MDFSYLSDVGPGAVVKLPDEQAIDQRRISLDSLARQNRVGALQEQGLLDQRAAAIAYNKAMPAIIQADFDPKVIAQTLQQYPEATIGVQKALEDHVARQDKRKTTEATVYKDQTKDLLTQFSQTAHGMADVMKTDPTAITDKMIANFYGKAADNGLGRFMPMLPFQDWADKKAVAAHLKQVGDAFYATSQQVSDKETARNNDVTAAGHRETRAETERAHRASEANAAGTLGLSRERFGWEKEKQKSEDGRPSKQVIDVELKVADDYKAQSKAFQETARSINLINTALNTADKNPGSALAAGTAFMKLLDPGSVVRESELGMALNASGWIDRARNTMSVLQHGKIMTAEQVVNLRAAARELFEEAKATQRQIDQQYAGKVSRYGGNPKNVILELGQNVTGEKTGSAASVGSTLRPEADGSVTYVKGGK